MARSDAVQLVELFRASAQIIGYTKTTPEASSSPHREDVLQGGMKLGIQGQRLTAFDSSDGVIDYLNGELLTLREARDGQRRVKAREPSPSSPPPPQELAEASHAQKQDMQRRLELFQGSREVYERAREARGVSSCSAPKAELATHVRTDDQAKSASTRGLRPSLCC